MFEKMEDVELVLRFFAYRHIQKAHSGLNKISEFLDSFLKTGNSFPVAVLDSYESAFNDTVDFLYDCLGDAAFTVIAEKPSRPTKIVYDPLMYAANSAHVVEARPMILANKDYFRQSLVDLYLNDRAQTRSIFAGRRTNSSDVLARNAAMKAMFDNMLKQICS